MANANPPQMARGRGKFIGSSGMVYIDQMAVDIYCGDYWQTAGYVHRVAVVCVAWGVSMATVQTAFAPVAGHPGPFVFTPNSLHIITVHDFGLHPFPPPGQLPNMPLGPPLPPIGIFQVNGQPRQGYRIPWHNRCQMQRSQAGANRMHYHQHYPREDHDFTPPDIKPQGVGSHRTFTALTYGTQVQGWRRTTE
ncbi:hypothetical protein BD413DRAFT_90983 [Trametes elegans]|nr:hypothetical protein BD413DRAFT_90983 [Trametes elegans]